MRELNLFFGVLFMLAMFASQSANAQFTVSGSNGADGTSYTSLTAASSGVFAKINTSSQSGKDIVITVTGSSTTETGATALTGAAGMWTSLKIYTSGTYTVSTASTTTPLIDLNGAKNITIDGRVGQTGSTIALTLTHSDNTSNSSSTIRFINDASNNTIQYCKITGACPSSGAGVILFSTTTGTTGNDNNTVDNCEITSSTARPFNVVYSVGTAAPKENSGNTISNNKIYNFLNTGLASNGIYIGAGSTDWSISGNSFYETTAFNTTVTAIDYSIIKVTNTSGNNFTVSGNYIGGSSTNCGGTWTKTSDPSVNNSFYAISISAGTTTASNVQGNTIQNINWTNTYALTGNNILYGIFLSAGSVNVGTTAGNTIGSSSGTGSVKLTTAFTGSALYGIEITSTGTVDCENNTIGSITTSNSAVGNSTNIYGIHKSGGGTTTISNNLIGSTGTGSSINASNISTTYGQAVYGINSAGSGTVTISGNTIANLKNGTTYQTTGVTGLIDGIMSTGGTNTITNNTVRDLTIGNGNSTALYLASVIGIGLNSTTAVTQTISGNTIYNLSNTLAAFTGNVIGLYYSGSTTPGTVSKNFIYGLSVTGATSTAASIYGIKINAGATTYSNNIISHSGSTKTNIYGIYETGAASNDNSLYFNTVYIGGSVASGATNKSYALYSAVTTNTRIFQNNIFYNARSTVSGASLHYAMYILAAGGTITCDYNDYIASGTGAMLGYFGGDVASKPIVTGQDINSVNINPLFSYAGGTTASNYKPSVTTLTGVAGTGITTDYSGVTRAATPTMGAFEVTPILAPTLISPANNSIDNPILLNLVWSKPQNTILYNVVLATDSIFSNIIINDSTLTDTVKSALGLSNDTKYFWKVRAKNIAGWSAFSSVWNFSTVLPLPAAPTLLTPANNSVDLSVTPALYWNNVTYAASYRVQISTSSAFTATVFDTAGLTVSQITIPGGILTTNTQYYWRVSATNISGTSAYSTVWNFTTAPTIPNVPLLALPASGATNQPTTLTFQWYKAIEQITNNKEQITKNGKDEITSISKYWFEYGTDSTFGIFIARDSSLTDTTKSLTGLSNITKYYWRVKAKNQTGWGGFSSTWNFTTIISSPNAPTLISPANNATGQALALNLVWSKITSATKYNIQLSTDPEFGSFVVNDSTLTDTNKALTSLNNITSYHWRVRSFNIGGWSSFSSAWTFTTIVPIPAVPALSSPANNAMAQPLALTLVWNKPNYATGYHVEFSTDPAFATTIVNDSTLTDSTRAISGLSTLTNYYWRVRAKNVSGWSSFSSNWTFKTIGTASQVVLATPANNAIGQPVNITFNWFKAIGQITNNKEQRTKNGKGGNSPDAISNYWFEYGTDSTFATVIARDSSLTDTTKSLTGLSNITKYYWRVKAKNQTGWGELSSIWNFTTILPIPAAPVLTSPASNSIGVSLTPALVWGSVTYAATYRIQVSADSNFATTAYDTAGVTATTLNVPANKLTGLTKYYWRVNAVNASGTGNWSTLWNFTTVQNLPITLKVYLEGFWDGSTQVSDTVNVYLANSLTPFALVDTAKVVLSATGTASFSFTKVTNGSYYIVVQHRNHLETWSKLPQALTTGITKSYDFTTAATQAFGDNMKQVGSVWVIYGGDANGDGSVDAIDVPIIIAQFGTQGYLAADFNGDQDVNAVDIALFSPNFGVTKVVPTVLMKPVIKTKDFEIKKIEKSEDKLLKKSK